MRAIASASRALALRPRAGPLLPRTLAAHRTLSAWQPPSARVPPSASGSAAASQFTPEEAEKLAELSEHEGPPRSSSQYTIRELADALVLGHAAELTVLDIRPVAGKPAVEWLIFATARSHSHMRTLARSVTSTLKSAGVQIFGRPPMVEGANAEDWMLVDAGKSVISILTADCRRSLNLEEHWQGLGAVTALQMPPAKLARATEAAAAAAASDLTGGDFVPGAPGDEIYRDDVPDSAPEYELRSARGRAGRAGATELMGEGADADEYEWEYCDYEVDYYEEEEGTTQLLDARGVGDGGGGGGRRGGGAARDLDRAADKAGRADGEADASAVEGEGYEYEEEYGYEYSEYSEEEEGEYGYEYEESYEEESYDDEEGGPVEERGGPRRSGDPPRKAE